MTGAATAKVGAVSRDVRADRAHAGPAGTVVLGRGELESVVGRALPGVCARDVSFDGRSGTRFATPARAVPGLLPQSRP